MRNILTNSSLNIQYKLGLSKTLVISFAGRGGKKDSFKRPVNEFYKLASNGDENHVLFVQDHSNSWMNGPEIAENICKCVNEIKSEIQATRVVTLGNSMGGTMALILTQLLPVDAAIALSPQYSVHPKIVPEDKRWMDDRKNIKSFRFLEVANLPVEQTKFTIVHGATDDELAHASRFPKDQGLAHFIFPNFGHDLASKLHRLGRLSPIVLNSIAIRPRRTRQAIAAAGGIRRKEFERLV
jgi:hypothetical protein